jgi:hypothetical protein
MSRLSAILLLPIFLLLATCSEQAVESPNDSAKSAAASADYLTPTLRAQVEALKAEVRNQPSTENNVAARSRLVYDWINAYALAGKYVPVNATQTVLRIGGYGQPEPKEVDELIAELTLGDEQPGAIGPLDLQPPGPFIAGSLATFSQIYTVGDASVQPGGGFLIANHFNANNGAFQVDDAASNNYVTISSSNPAVSFTRDSFPVAGMHGGFRGAQGQLVFRVAGGPLSPGDRVTVTYGDTSGGGAGLEMPDFNSELMPFPLYLDLDGSNLWLSIPMHGVPVVGSTVATVTGFAPSIVTPGEIIELSIRAADEFGNRAQGAIPGWHIVDDQGNTIAKVAANGAAVALSEISFASPGVYRLSVASEDGNVQGTFNPILVEDNPSHRVFWGETHGHSGFAEGIGSPTAYMEFARDEARLDFVTHSEHDLWMDDSEWNVMQRMVEKYYDEGRFLTYLGYEWTSNRTLGGHHNVLFRTPQGRQRLPTQLYPSLSALYQGLREQNDTNDVLIIPHAHQKGDYRLSDPDMETLVEIMSMHGTFEWFARMYVDHGHRVGFVAASDDHIGKPGFSMPKNTSLAQHGGLAAVLAPARTGDAIFDAMKSLRTYATTGQRMIVDMTVNGTSMGQQARYSESRQIAGRVIGTAPIRSITLFKNDHVLEEWGYNEVSGEDLALTFYSESYPYHPDDNPRGWRHWRGTITVEGAELASAELSDRQNLSFQRVEPVDGSPNTLRFATMTRGDHSSVILKFNGSSAGAVVKISLDTSNETGSGPPQLRTHQRIPGQEVTLALQGGDEFRQDVSFDGYQDSITLSREGQMPLEVEFSTLDQLNPRQGDYYFVRVRQADEGLAWTSPVWVGGARSR